MSDPEIQAAPDANETEDGQDLAVVTTSTEVAAPTEKKVKKIIRRKKRPARPQVDQSFITDEPPPQTGNVWNLWYNKWSGMKATLRLWFQC
jgi:hypothetical protein